MVGLKATSHSPNRWREGQGRDWEDQATFFPFSFSSPSIVKTWWGFLFRVNVSHRLHSKNLKPKQNNTGSCLDFTARKHMEKVERMIIKNNENYEIFQN